MASANDRLQAPWVGCGPDGYDETEEERYQAMSDFEYDLERDMADMENYWEGAV